LLRLFIRQKELDIGVEANLLLGWKVRTRAIDSNDAIEDFQVADIDAVRRLVVDRLQGRGYYVRIESDSGSLFDICDSVRGIECNYTRHSSLVGLPNVNIGNEPRSLLH
jgi:hypothetical protein